MPAVRRPEQVLSRARAQPARTPTSSESDSEAASRVKRLTDNYSDKLTGAEPAVEKAICRLPVTHLNLMAKLAHITDLHSGRHDDRIADALIDSLSEQAPDQIVIGGDLTQRSRRSEWRRAVGWLDRMPAPWIATPGNHDIPMFDFTRRAVSPFGRFRLNVGEDLEPSARVGGALVICVRTASPHRRVEGAVSRESLTQLRETLDAGRGDSPIVLVTHHPLALHPASQRAGHTVVSGDELLTTAEAGGVDLLLSGHTHRPHRGRPFSVNLGGRNLIAAHGGTACSTRTRADEPPSWQMVTMEPSRIALTMFAWDGDRFTPGDQSVWQRTESAGWMEES